MPPVAFEVRAFSGSAISESRISVKVLGKKTSRCGELFANQSQSNQPCSHCKFWIFRLLWFWTCCFQFLCHFGKCKAKLNVAFQLSCVKSVFLFCCRLVKLEKSKFDCAFCKGCVEVQHMVSAVIVMLISAVIRTVCCVPDVCKLCHCGWFLFVQLFNESWVYRSAISVHSALVDFQSICNQSFVACHDVCKVSEALRCVSVRSDVNMNSCPNPCVAYCSCLAKSSHKLLQGFNVAVVKNRCNQFALFSIASCNADVLLKFPFSALCIPS